MPTVLCADDSSDIRRLIQQVLAHDGLEVVLADNGASALEIMVQRPLDGVVLDINMPVMDGLDVLRRMAADPRLATVPVMMLTANSQAANVQEALASGARDFVVKPFEPAALRQRVRRMLGARPAAEPSARATETTVAGVTRVVLVADDQPAVLDLASELLNNRFEIVTARTGAGALAQAIEHRPAAVLMDLSMPIMGGVEALRRIRQQPELAATKVLAMGLGGPDEAPLLEGFDGVVRKPIERLDATRALCRALGISGLFAFLSTTNLVVLRFFPAKLWDPVENEAVGLPYGFWEARDLEPLRDESERVFGRMIEAGQRQLLLDLGLLTDPPERHIGALVTAVRQVVGRAEACRLTAAVVAPFRLARHFEGLRAEFGVAVCWRTADALRSLQRRTEREGRV